MSNWGGGEKPNPNILHYKHWRKLQNNLRTKDLHLWGHRSSKQLILPWPSMKRTRDRSKTVSPRGELVGISAVRYIGYHSSSQLYSTFSSFSFATSCMRASSVAAVPRSAMTRLNILPRLEECRVWEGDDIVAQQLGVSVSSPLLWPNPFLIIKFEPERPDITSHFRLWRWEALALAVVTSLALAWAAFAEEKLMQLCSILGCSIIRHKLPL